jgi:phage protein D
MSDQVSAKHRRGTGFTVKYPTLPNILTVPHSIQIQQKMGHHDIAIMEFRVAHENMFKNLKTGVPVQITWNQDGLSRTLHAYVSHVAKDTIAQRKNYFRVHCIGGSFPLKKRTTKVYTKKTISDVARIIAKENGLKFVGENHPRRFDQLTMAGHSQWEWLQENAKKIGFGVMVDGLNLVFKPLDKLLNQSITAAATMSMFDSTVPMGTFFYDRTLDSIEVLNGENIEMGDELRTIKSVGGVNPVTGKSFNSKKNPKSVGKNIRKNVSDTLFNETVQTQVVNDSISAKHAAEGKAHLARLNLPASVKGQGDPRLKPWAPVNITGTGEDTDGVWVINSVTHFLGSVGTYFVEMVVSTDGLGTSRIASYGSAKSTSHRNPAGTIDVSLALKNQNVKVSPKSVRLSSKNGKKGVMVESKQGFNRTPTVWKAASIGPRRMGK